MRNYYVSYRVWTPDVTCEADVEKIGKDSLLMVKSIYNSKEVALSCMLQSLSAKKTKRFDFEDKICFSELKENGERSGFFYIIQRIKGESVDIQHYVIGLSFKTLHITEGALAGGVCGIMFFHKKDMDLYTKEEFEDQRYFDCGFLHSTLYILIVEPYVVIH